MPTLHAILFKLFGASWFTSILGYTIIAGSVSQLVVDALAEGGMPATASGWLGLVTGIAIRFTKQSNVSNSPHPIAVAQPVIAEEGAKLAETPKPIAKP